jgi:DnaK suppressor protein
MIHADLHVTAPQHREPTVPSAVAASMTETQVLAMTESDYLNPAQLDFFKSRLEAIELELLDKAARADAEIAVGAAGSDPVDRASVEEEHRMVLASRERDAEQLIEVRAALTRIATGDFGYCSETGEPIGVARLLIRPTTVLTTEAQQRQETLSRRFRA